MSEPQRLDQHAHRAKASLLNVYLQALWRASSKTCLHLHHIQHLEFSFSKWPTFITNTHNHIYTTSTLTINQQTQPHPDKITIVLSKVTKTSPCPHPHHKMGEARTAFSLPRGPSRAVWTLVPRGHGLMHMRLGDHSRDWATSLPGAITALIALAVTAQLHIFQKY